MAESEEFNKDHRRMGERRMFEITQHPLFKIVSVLGNLVIAGAVAWGTFAWNTVQKDIQDIRNNYSQMQTITNVYNSERLAISQRLDAFTAYQTDALNRGRESAAKIAKMEAQLERHDRDIGELRNSRK